MICEYCVLHELRTVYVQKERVSGMVLTQGVMKMVSNRRQPVCKEITFMEIQKEHYGL